MQVFCMNYWYIFGQERPTQEQLHGRSGLFISIWFWLVRLFYQWQLYTRKPDTWIIHTFFWPRKANTRTARWTFWSFYAYMTLAFAPVLPVPAIYKNSLYMILACVAKCMSSAWITGKFSGQETPAQEQLHGRSGLFTPIWYWLVRLFYQCQVYIRTAYTWF